MNADQTVIQSAYEDAIKRAYAAFVDGFMQANGDPSKEQQAEQRFMRGVDFARTSRDRAISCVFRRCE
jgi:hypothetical protein